MTHKMVVKTFDYKGMLCPYCHLGYFVEAPGGDWPLVRCSECDVHRERWRSGVARVDPDGDIIEMSRWFMGKGAHALTEQGTMKLLPEKTSALPAKRSTHEVTCGFSGWCAGYDDRTAELLLRKPLAEVEF